MHLNLESWRWLDDYHSDMDFFASIHLAVEPGIYNSFYEHWSHSWTCSAVCTPITVKSFIVDVVTTRPSGVIRGTLTCEHHCLNAPCPPADSYLLPFNMLRGFRYTSKWLARYSVREARIDAPYFASNKPSANFSRAQLIHPH